MAEFGAELKRLRESAGMSLTALAGVIPASKGYLSKIENGRVPVKRTIAEACDKALAANGRLVAMITEAGPVGPRKPRALVGLPDGTRHFVGRSAELITLTAILRQPDEVRVCVINGMAGVGKTAVAIAAARSVIDDFPDGCLFFDLHGHTPGAPVLSPTDGLRRVLGLLDVPGDRIPADIDGQANLFQSLLRDRRLLLVYDNVRTAQQVRRMLPAEPGCRVIITSRARLPALDDAWPISVGVLSTVDATALFRSTAGPAVAETDSVAQIVSYCGMLPLAIRIAAARFVAGGWTTTSFANRLADENTRLSSLDDGERSVAAVFKVSYDALPADQRWLFGLLALHPTTAAETAAVEALADLPPGEVDRLLDRLHDAHLLYRDPAGYIELHDLMRTFAARYALPEIGVPERTAAAGRLVDYTLARVFTADQLVEPHRFRPVVDVFTEPFDTADSASSWLRAHWPALAQTTELASRIGRHQQCWQLAYLLRSFFFRERLLVPWISTHKVALAAAQQAGDVNGAGMILNNLGMGYLQLGEVDLAIDCHHRAQECFEETGDERGATDAVSSRGWALLAKGDLVGAHRDLESTLTTYRRTGRSHNVVIALRGLAFVRVAQDRFDDAVEYARRARDLAVLPQDVLMSINCLAWIEFRAGRLAAARNQYRAAVDLAELVDSDYELARAVTGLGNIAAQRGDYEEAEHWWAQADDYGVLFNPRVLGEAAARLGYEDLNARR